MDRIDADDPRLRWWSPQPIDVRGSGTTSEVRLNRFPRRAQQLLMGQIGPMANLRSSSGCALVLRTDSPWLIVELAGLRHHQSAPVGIDSEVELRDGSWQLLHSGDLRPQSGAVSVRFATGLERGGDLRTIWVHLPLISTCAVAGIRLTQRSRLTAATLPEPQWLALGDSFTQGFIVQQPGQHWLHLSSRRLDLPAWNLGIGGLKIEAELFQEALASRTWSLVTVGLGANHCWQDADVVSVTDRAQQLAESLLAGGHRRLCWFLPGWKPFEAGKGPGDFMGVPLDAAAGHRLQAVREALQAALSPYPAIDLLADLLPDEAWLYPDGLHPQATGAACFADALAARLT